MDVRVLKCEPFLDLLGEFYVDMADSQMIDVRPLAAEDVPEPAQTLLVHQRDMTSTLERFYGEPIQLKILQSNLVEDRYSRHIVLETGHTNRPVEYGAIRIHLPLLSEEARAEVLEGRTPLGGILNAHRLTYRSCPSAFFEIDSNRFIEEAFGLTTSASLCGRCNCLTDQFGRTIAEVIEILPPAHAAEKNAN